MKLASVSIFTAGALALTLGYGYMQVNSQQAPMFTQTGKAITVASSTSLSVERFTQGGGVTATTSATAVTLVASDFDTENLIEMTPTSASITATVTGSSTFPLGTNPGSMREFGIFNATGTNGVMITLAKNTGVSVIASSTATTTPAVINAKGIRWFTAVRKINSDIEVWAN